MLAPTLTRSRPSTYLCFVPLLVTQHSNRHPGKRGKLEARKLRIELRFVQAQRPPTRTRTSPQSLQPCGTYLLFTSFLCSSLSPPPPPPLRVNYFRPLLIEPNRNRPAPDPCFLGLVACSLTQSAVYTLPLSWIYTSPCSRSTHTRTRNARDSLCRQCYLSRKCMAVSPTHPFPVVPGASTTPVEKHRFFD